MYKYHCASMCTAACHSEVVVVVRHGGGFAGRYWYFYLRRICADWVINQEQITGDNYM